jgi:hypothetical protein
LTLQIAGLSWAKTGTIGIQVFLMDKSERRPLIMVNICLKNSNYLSNINSVRRLLLTTKHASKLFMKTSATGTFLGSFFLGVNHYKKFLAQCIFCSSCLASKVWICFHDLCDSGRWLVAWVSTNISCLRRVLVNFLLYYW